MKPFDVRLLRYAKSTRGLLILGAILGVLRTLAIIAWCWCLSQAIAVLIVPVLGGEHYGIVLDQVLDEKTLPWLITGALAALLVRAGTSWAMDVVAAHGAIRSKTEIRDHALNVIDGAHVDHFVESSDSAPTTVLGRGLDALDGYYSQYIPQLILTVCATPLLIFTVFLVDWTSALVVVLVFPVIPIFMILIGFATQAVQKKQWNALQHLSASFMDVVAGLTTLKIFRREHIQRQRIRAEAEEYRSRTMKLLRVTFLSGFVLDLAGTFSIALVAVTVGTRLIDGRFSLALGMFVLLVLPEVFIPIRQVGAAFHASTEGIEAAQSAFQLIEDTQTQRSTNPERTHSSNGHIVLHEVQVKRGEHTTIGPVSLTAPPGQITAIAGPSGAGKSSLVAALMGFTVPSSGTIERPAKVSWCGQQPGLLQGSIAENLALGDEKIDHDRAQTSLETVGLGHLPLTQQLGPLGSGLSGGQAQRLAIARCLYHAWATSAPALILDEPTSALDTANENLVMEALHQVAQSGRTVLVVSHRPGVLENADAVHEIGVTV